MSRTRSNINEKETKTYDNSKIYTLAHAVRSNKLSYKTNSAKCIPKNGSPEIEEEFKTNIKSRPTVLRQPRSHLPMNMIVSKMATRKRLNKENEIPANKIDLSVYRKYPLEPPPWRNVLRSNKRHQSSELEKLVLQMKHKRSELDSSSQHNHSTVSKDESSLDHKRVESLLLNGNSDPQDCTVMDTPRLQYHYDQLYGGQWRTIEDEDPLSVDSPDQQVVKEVNPRPAVREPLPQVVPDVSVPDFVWNPMISCKPKTQLFDCVETATSKQMVYFPRNVREELQSCSNTPARESSSTSSSDHIVTEESIQLTIFAKHGDLSMIDHDNFSAFPGSPSGSWD